MSRPSKSKTVIDSEESSTYATQNELAEENRVRHAIIEAVLSHRLLPGTRLVETQLCEAFGINRSLLRRVFVRLGGAIIAQPLPEEMHQILEARQLIETGILRALGKKATPESLATIRELVNQEQAAYQDGDWSRWIRLSGEYHLQMARLLGNTELEEILRSLLARTTLTFALHYSLGGNVCSFHEHNDILQALESGDSEHACALMDAHLHGVQTKLHRDASPSKIDFVALFSQPT